MAGGLDDGRADGLATGLGLYEEGELDATASGFAVPHALNTHAAIATKPTSLIEIR